MSSTTQRYQAFALAKSNPKQSLENAKTVKEPWFRAQELAAVARYADSNPVEIAKQAAKAMEGFTIDDLADVGFPAQMAVRAYP